MQQQGKFILYTREEFKGWLFKTVFKRQITALQNHHTYIPNYTSFNGKNHFNLAVSMENYHVNTNKMSEIAQNITTFSDGSIMICRTFEKDPGGFAGAVNNKGHICMEHIGNFDISGDKMTEEHKKTIVFLNAILCSRFNLSSSISTILYHHFVSEKSCPGTNFFGGNTQAAAKANFIPLIEQQIVQINDINKKATTHWGQPLLDKLKQKGIISSDHDPDEPITWAELASVLLKVIDSK